MSDRDISPRDVYVRGESRSRSRSRSDRDREDRRSRSRSRDAKHRTARSRDNKRSRSRSPIGSSRRHSVTERDRDRPQPSRCVGVFGLSIYTNEKILREYFSKFGRVEDVQIVFDAQSGRSRGFGFVYYETEDDAYEAKEKANGSEIDGRKIRVDFSITKRAHTPTPGVYMGRPTRRSRRHGERGSGSDRDRDRYPERDREYDRRDRKRYTRSPSPYSRDRRGGAGGDRGRDRYREREKSFSPRRYY